MSLKDLFNMCKIYGIAIRSATLNFPKLHINGLIEWGKVKILLSNSEKEICDGWKISRYLDDKTNKNSNFDNIYDYIHDNLNIKGGDEDYDNPCDENYVWKRYHFFLQTIRIPKLNPKCSLLRVCQIGYNLGQLNVHHKDYCEKAIIFFKLNKLDDIESYIDITKCNQEKDYTDIINNIKILIDTLNEKIRISSTEKEKEKKKYLKYKIKYLKYKKVI